MSTSSTDDLTSFVLSMGGDRSLRVEENLGDGFVRLRVSEAERRQAADDIRCTENIVVELLRNARDAGARNIFLATSCEAGKRSLVMLDDGSGIPEEMREHIFDARVTSKLETVHEDIWGIHGRGMALYSIRENSLEARVVDSVMGGGSVIRVSTDTATLPEKADQSTWPTTGTNEEGERALVRGPHNIIRSCCEFALAERRGCELYLGTPAEIVATIRSRVQPSLSPTELMFVDDLCSLPPLERFRAAADARELRAMAASAGIEISERTAHRILAGQIKPLRSVFSRLSHTSAPQKHEVDLYRDRRGLKLSKEDLEEFSRMMERDFELIAKRYFLRLSESPRVRVAQGRMSVSFDFESLD